VIVRHALILGDLDIQSQDANEDMVYPHETHIRMHTGCDGYS
jgi:hypothetical protein